MHSPTYSLHITNSFRCDCRGLEQYALIVARCNDVLLVTRDKRYISTKLEQPVVLLGHLDR